ncbi:hypothetical protein P7C70_g9341, partial [Phenoliferia sp. Uapishka_3]
MFALRNLVNVVSPLFTQSRVAIPPPAPSILAVGSSKSITKLDTRIAHPVALSSLIDLDSPTLPLRPASDSLRLLQATHSGPQSAREHQSHPIPTIIIDASCFIPLADSHLEDLHYTTHLPQSTLNLLVPTPGVHDRYYGSSEEVAKAAVRKAARKARKLEKAKKEAAKKEKEVRKEARREERERKERAEKATAEMLAREIEEWVKKNASWSENSFFSRLTKRGSV